MSNEGTPSKRKRLDFYDQVRNCAIRNQNGIVSLREIDRVALELGLLSSEDLIIRRDSSKVGSNHTSDQATQSPSDRGDN